MRRLVGAALLCIGAAAPGFALAARLGRRVTDLEAMRAGVLAIERGLRSGLLPLEELLRQAARAAGGRGEVFFCPLRRRPCGALRPELFRPLGGGACGLAPGA